MPITCPVCGSNEVKTTKRPRTLRVAFGPDAAFEEREDRCKTCGESGDFAGENDSRIDEALDISRRKSVPAILAALSETGIKNAYLERSLGLPTRTIARWKAGDYSASMLALLRMVRTFPWLLEVADENYESNVARRKVVEAAAGILSQAVAASPYSVSPTVARTRQGYSLHFEFERSVPLLDQSAFRQEALGWQFLTASEG